VIQSVINVMPRESHHHTSGRSVLAPAMTYLP
jgi:hypothetical protein